MFCRSYSHICVNILFSLLKKVVRKYIYLKGRNEIVFNFFLLGLAQLKVKYSNKIMFKVLLSCMNYTFTVFSSFSFYSVYVFYLKHFKFFSLPFSNIFKANSLISSLQDPDFSTPS